MGTEIERKFLVTGESWRIGESTPYLQGYLNHERHRTVRVRVAGNDAMLTVKGISIGISRAEYEYSIPLSDAMQMLELCDGALVEKKRWLASVGNMTWEIDEFIGLNQGLVIAEIELEYESQNFELPNWVDKEVTGDDRYFNSNLSKAPFTTWDS